MSHEGIRDALLRIDDSKVSIDNLLAIKHYIPTTDEAFLPRSFSRIALMSCDRLKLSSPSKEISPRSPLPTSTSPKSVLVPSPAVEWR